MARVLVRLTLVPWAPPPVVRRVEGEQVAPFGRWLRERIASTALDWPKMAFHRVHLTPRSLELVVITPAAAPALPGALLVARAVARELDLAARRTGWVRGALWTDMGLWVSGERRLVNTDQ